MRIVYLGTPDFAVAPLNALARVKGAEVVAAICNEDKPFGRKQILTPPPVKVAAQALNIPVFQYKSIRKQGVEDFKALKPDLAVTCAFGQILSEELLGIPKFGVINVHASLLPRWRGASPIHYAILNGDNTTGITVMKTDAGIDTGDVMFQRLIDIGETETCGELFDRLSALGAECAVEAVSRILSGNATFSPQDNENATYSKMIKKEDALIDWTAGAKRIVDKVRAMNPFPTAFTFLNGVVFKVYRAEQSEISGEAGKVVCSDGKLIVGAGESSVSLTEVCAAGGKKMSAADFLRGNHVPVGTVFGR